MQLSQFWTFWFNCAYSFTLLFFTVLVFCTDNDISRGRTTIVVSLFLLGEIGGCWKHPIRNTFSGYYMILRSTILCYQSWSKNKQSLIKIFIFFHHAGPTLYWWQSKLSNEFVFYKLMQISMQRYWTRNIKIWKLILYLLKFCWNEYLKAFNFPSRTILC